jgi:hypothetical protein
MKKLFTLVAAFAFSTAMFAQITITYQIDVTPFINDGNTIVNEGIRIGGNFTDNGSTTPNWNPDDAASAMTNLGGNIWSIDITFPSASAGQTQLFKFVNGTWGSNEGAATLEACGVDDGNGGFNRTMIIPAADETICVQWDLCDACDGASIEKNEIASVNVYPNPANEVISFQVALNGVNTADVIISDLSGRTMSAGVINAGSEFTVNVSDFAAGTYLYTVVTGGSVMTGKFMKD